MTIREALTQSLNVPAVVVLDAVGPARLVARLKRAGAAPALPDLTAPGLAIGLGGVGISLRDLVSALCARSRAAARRSTLRDGVDDRPIMPAAEPARRCWRRSPPGMSPTSSPDVPPPLNGSPGRIAYKTGTSYGYRDAWAIGFDGRHVIGVWVGRPDGTPVSGLSGISTAAPILFEAFDRLGAKRVALKGPPPGASSPTTAALPPPLRRFRHPERGGGARTAIPRSPFRATASPSISASRPAIRGRW